MTEQQKIEINTIRKIADDIGISIVRMWRENRKGTDAIHGRQLKFAIPGASEDALKRFAEEVATRFGYVFELRNIDTTYFRKNSYVAFKLKK